MTGDRKSEATLLDHHMPKWHFREHHWVAVEAPREEVLRAAREITWREAPVARFLLAFTRNRLRPDGRVLDDFAMGGDTVLALGDNEFLYGGIGSQAGPVTPEQPMHEVFRDYAEPGCTKVGFNMLYHDGKLATETRILATDERTRRSFGRYWAVIRVPSGVIRIAILAAIKRRVDGGRKKSAGRSEQRPADSQGQP
ncbi:hypothetical protein [Streptomyces peucetius]|uniref:BioF2-like acetyltransferase domain-containing protein n=1 Tax=Streptomyces peucetius TaxID=1950 RepID=A0ABY6IFY3_STRPE|nr:hypothetical protein [Streptomyces peucetius]UYQ64834.1 hypothetical protein OGH68_27500 [Streptomyces peucetius]